MLCAIAMTAACQARQYRLAQQDQQKDNIMYIPYMVILPTYTVTGATVAVMGKLWMVKILKNT